MRLIAKSRWQTGRCARAQEKSRNLRPESCRVGPYKIVVTFHESFAGFEDAEALVFMHLAGRDQRLLSYDALPFDFRVLTNRVMDQPASREELRRVSTDILDSYEIRKHIMTGRRLGLLAQIYRPDRDSYPVRLFVVERRC